jgi:hypothetical protein
MSGMLGERFIQLALILTALTQLPPVIGVVGPEALTKLYGINVADPGLMLLLRHRAVMFAIVAVPLLIAVVMPAWRVPALCAALLSVASFIALAPAADSLSLPVQRVLRVDWFALALLLPAMAVTCLQKPIVSAG